MNAQQEAVALFRFLESRGFKPSARSVGIGLRAHKIAFRDADLRAWLEPFLQSRAAARPVSAESRPHESSTLAESGTVPAEDGPRLRAHNKVSLATKKNPTGSALPLGLDAQPAVKARRSPSPADLAAWSLLSALAERIGEFHGLPVRDWKARNKAAALSMLASGVTEDEWLDFWDDRAKVGKRFTVLKFMQEAYAAQAFRERREPNESESLPTTADLIAAGVIPAPTEEETAAMVASRPAWFNAQLAAQA